MDKEGSGAPRREKGAVAGALSDLKGFVTFKSAAGRLVCAGLAFQTVYWTLTEGGLEGFILALKLIAFELPVILIGYFLTCVWKRFRISGISRSLKDERDRER